MESTRFCQVAEAGVKGRACLRAFIMFLWERQARETTKDWLD